MPVPIEVNWRELMLAIKRKGMNDGDIVERLGSDGVFIERATLGYLRNGKTKNPHYQMAAGLLNIYESLGEIDDYSDRSATYNPCESHQDQCRSGCDQCTGCPE